MVFNPEDEQNFGPHCRNCHKGSSRCATCHNTSSTGAVVTNAITASDNTTNKSTYTMGATSDGQPNTLAQNIGSLETSSTSFAFFKKSRTANWNSDWRQSGTAKTAADIDAMCADDGFSWPHRTLGWKMLKDDLFGLDFDNNRWVGVGETRTAPNGVVAVAHDLDSVCLDCHNPTVWNATSASDHIDSPTLTTDNHDDELLTRGLP